MQEKACRVAACLATAHQICSKSTDKQMFIAVHPTNRWNYCMCAHAGKIYQEILSLLDGCPTFMHSRKSIHFMQNGIN